MVSRVDGDEVVSRVDKEVVPEVDRINKPVADHGISNQQQQGNNNSSYNTTNDIISINDSDSSNSKEEKYDLDESDQLDSDDEQFVTSLSPPLQPSQPPQQVQGQQEDPSTIQLDESGGAGTTDNDGDDAESLLKENRVCRKVGYGRIKKKKTWARDGMA
ncbi:hypothetical protein BC941DRAFT_37765 [Chlamydoabsidia padenii]|nr:hypothetical protein BC941DRAFT_37765 [Chlamydoabsidia padenii]